MTSIATPAVTAVPATVAMTGCAITAAPTLDTADLTPSPAPPIAERNGTPPPRESIRLPAKESTRVPVIFDCAREWIGPADTDKPYLYRQGPAGAKSVGMMYWAAMDRHNAGVNVVFLDGHAEHVTVPRLWKLKWSETFQSTEVAIQK